MDMGELEDDYQTMAHLLSKLRYDGRSRLWVTCLLKRAAGDTLVREELLFQLLEIPTRAALFVPWSDMQEESLCLWAPGQNSIHCLLTLVREYELQGPHQVGRFHTWSACAHVPHRLHRDNGYDMLHLMYISRPTCPTQAPLRRA
jgi:hypothetical protein